MRCLHLWILTTFALPAFVWAQTPAADKHWAHESEAALVNVGGNTTSESYSAKQKTSYTLEANKLVAAGSYLETKANGVETAHAWDASLRYERSLNDKISGYVSHGAEANHFAGYIQRDNSDLGAKYNISKTDTHYWLAEAGYRYTSTIQSNLERTHSSFGRVYTEYGFNFNTQTSFKIWLEFLPNFSNSDAYLANAEPSMSLIMTEILSLKLAYLMKYHNKLIATGEKYMDTTFTTALVAKF